MNYETGLPELPRLAPSSPSRVVWCRTSTDPGWPSSDHPMPLSAVDLIAGSMPMHAVRRARRRYETQALHLGTYEAAIESMLRRMREQGDSPVLPLPRRPAA